LRACDAQPERLFCESKRRKFVFIALIKELLVRRLVTRWAAVLAVGAALVGAWAMRPTMDRMWRGDSRALAATSGALQLATTSGASTAGCPLAAAFSFCDQAPGSTGPTATFTLTATSAASSLSVKLAAVPGLSSSFSAGDFTIAPNNCGGSLAANASCTIGVAFTPLAASKGLREAALIVTDSNTSDQATVNLAGRASGLALALPPALTCSAPTPAAPGDNAYTFCPQAIHTTSTAQTFTLTAQNTVTGVTLAFAAVPGLSSEFAANDFTIQSTTCASVLTAGASCTAVIAFTPTATGFRAAQLTATDSTSDSTSVTLAGLPTSGLAIAPQAEPLTCSPRNAFEFCNTPLGGTSPANTYTLENTSGVQLTGVTVPAATSAGDFKVSSNSCVPTMAAGASCTISVVFLPQTSGLLQEPLTVTDAGGDTATINLAGTGDNFTVQLASSTPTQIDVNQGGTATYAAQIIPDAVFGAEGEKVAPQCPATTSLPTDVSCSISPCPASITPGTTTNFTVTIVTSSTDVIAPTPTGAAGCVSYGPGPVVTGGVGPAAKRAPGDFFGGGKDWPNGAAPWLWRFPAPNVWAGSNADQVDRIFAALGALAMLAGLTAFATAWIMGGAFRKPCTGNVRRRAMLLAGVAIVALAAAGCHGSKKTFDPATAQGTYAFSVQGTATDANGNSFNTSRSVQLNLDVVAGAVSTGFGSH
jgi:hypothetical protein